MGIRPQIARHDGSASALPSKHGETLLVIPFVDPLQYELAEHLSQTGISGVVLALPGLSCLVLGFSARLVELDHFPGRRPHALLQRVTA